MRRRPGWLPALLLMALPASGPLRAEDRSKADDADRLAATIDRLIAEKWETAGVRPAPPADDAEFLRRVTLDLTGRIPTAAAVREFLDDPGPDKRARKVDALLKGAGFTRHQTTLWKGLMLPEVTNNFQLGILGGEFEGWLRKQIAEGVGYDEMVRQIVSMKLSTNRNEPVDIYGQRGDGESRPFAFIYAKEAKPENLAAASARLFLGVRIECAQCHDHPFARWKREQFWGMAAFFAGVDRNGNDDFFQPKERPDRREIEVPGGSERVIQAAFLDGGEPPWKWSENPRVTLARWMTSRENPYFARATANRVWAQYFGTGLVDPVDDLGGESAPSHPELLDELARQFAEHDFDLRFLARAITLSRTYGLSSRGYSPGQDDPQLFARATMRGLSPVQLYDNLVQAAGLKPEQEMPPFFLSDSPRKDFVDRFSAAGADTKATDFQTSILQALTLMNGRLSLDATDLERGDTLASVASSYFLDTPERIEALYLATLSRRPRPDELGTMVEYVERGGDSLDPRKALGDVLWALINSAEFVLNH